MREEEELEVEEEEEEEEEISESRQTHMDVSPTCTVYCIPLVLHAQGLCTCTSNQVTRQNTYMSWSVYYRGLPTVCTPQVTHAKFVEEKILSHERAISSLSPHPPHTLPPPLSSCRHTSTRPPAAVPRVGMAMQSRLTFGMGVAEMDLSRRLRFEARVLTQ